jgi:polysaccharide export outer membrane protein
VSYAQVEEYVLKPGDVISVAVVEHPEFSGRHKIRPDGRINYPVIGELEVASLTCAQLVKIMQGKLTSYVNNPVVSVSIEAYYSNKIYVIGDARSPGEYEIYEPIDILKAIAMAGGLQSARTKMVKIIRADGSVIDVNLRALYQPGNKRTKNQILYPGDTIFVPQVVKVPWSMISTILSIISTSLSIIITVTVLSNK